MLVASRLAACFLHSVFLSGMDISEVSKVMHRPFPGLLDASDLMDRLTLAKDLPCVLSSISDRDDDSSAMCASKFWDSLSFS